MNGNLQKQPPLLPPPQSACDTCNRTDQLILHNVKETLPKSPLQKLCTKCVLKQYKQSYCAECFELYDTNLLSQPPQSSATATAGNSRLLWCMRCKNWSHNWCPGKKTPKEPYICPPCRTPNYDYFDAVKHGEGGGRKRKAVDLEAAKQLEGASRIACITMTRAAATARTEAERKGKDAALARLRAREAIDHVFSIAAKVEGAKRREMSTATGPKIGNYVPVRLERNGASTSNVEIKNAGGRAAAVGVGAGAVVTVPVPVSVVMPGQHKSNGSVGGAVVAVQGVSNAGQSQF